jgi:hypothetical protein
MELRALNASNFKAFASLFTADGSGCYCAVWRTYDETWEQRCNDRAHPNRELANRLVNDGSHWGFLAFDGGTLMGWTASGPKTEFPLLKTKLGSRMTPFESSIWSVGCIAFKKAKDSELNSSQMIAAVARKAMAAGAEFLEAYPTDPWDQARGYRGSYLQYLQLGFREHSSEEDDASRVVCMRLKL